LALRGWVADPAGSKVLSELQYCYVNGRMMRDRLINHAIRQAYQDKLGDQHQPAYVLYLEIDPHQVDVNVHPAKHEVRFHQSRLVHDFIYQGVVSVLQETGHETLPDLEPGTPADRWQPENRQAAGGNHFSTPASKGADYSSGAGAGFRLDPGATDTPRSSVGSSSSSADVRSAAAGASSERPPGALAAAMFPHRRQEPVYQKREGAAYQQLMNTPPPRCDEPALPVPEKSPEPLREIPLSGHAHSFGRVLTVLHQHYALVENAERLSLIALTVAERWLKQAQLEPDAEGLKPQPLLIPVRLKLDKTEREAMSHSTALLNQMGIELLAEGQHVMLRAVPLPLRQQNLQNLIPELLGYLARQQDVSASQIAQWLARQSVSEHQHWNHSQAIALLADVERLCPQLVKSPPSGLVQIIDINMAMNALKYE